MNKFNTNKLLTMGAASLVAAVVVAGCSAGQSEPSTPQPSTPQPSTPAATPAANHEHEAPISATKLEFSSSPENIPVGKPATWTLKITDAQSGAPIDDFETEMTKLMHLIVVSRDLSWFNHLHPKYQGKGVFTVTTTLPKAGGYKLYADFTRKGRAKEVPQHEFATGGQTPAETTVMLEASAAKNNWLTQKVSSHPESEPDAPGGATYIVALMPMPSTPVAGQNVMLHFQIRDANGKPLKDLQPYLGAMGHCVILSGDTNLYLHSHPMSGGMGDMKMGDDMKGMDMKGMGHDAPPTSGGPDVIFHTNFPSGGMYKVWGQFRHKGKIITAPFVLAVNVATAPPAGKTDESKSHSH